MQKPAINILNSMNNRHCRQFDILASINSGDLVPKSGRALSLAAVRRRKNQTARWSRRINRQRQS